MVLKFKYRYSDRNRLLAYFHTWNWFYVILSSIRLTTDFSAFFSVFPPFFTKNKTIHSIEFSMIYEN